MKKKTFLTKKDREEIRAHFRDTDCPMKKQKVLLETMDQLQAEIDYKDRLLKDAEKGLEFMEVRRQATKLMWEFVKMVYFSEDDPPRSAFEVNLAKLQVDYRFWLMRFGGEV